MTRQPSTTPDNKTRQSSLDRRRFMSSGLRAAAGAGIAGLALMTGAKHSTATAPPAIRPPGALAENLFAGACVRCGLCVRDCPYDILDLADYGSEPATGTPYFVARDKACEMCDDIPCVAACPSGALSKSLTDINDARMGLAVIVSQETCLNFLGLRCDVCFRICPLMDKAITLEMERNPRTGRHARFLPTVHSDYCTGCGKCEKACVLEKAAIKVLPINLVKGKIDKHYRVGWDEKNTIRGARP